MPEAPRHAKLKSPATRLRPVVVAAATLAGVAAAFMLVSGGAAAPKPAHVAIPVAVTSSGPVTDTTSSFTAYQVTAEVRRDAAALRTRAIRRIARRKQLAAIAAARLAQQQAAQQAAAQQAAQQQAAQQAAAQSPQPSPSPSPSPPQSGSGGNAANSPLGVCIRNAEEGGSYAWGPGNGGGAYQFQLGTWEVYGGAASEYGVAGPAYQDQIFDNAIAAGGASNWTNYDGC
jgi:hypothetical protein